jgi:hypothetical protein
MKKVIVNIAYLICLAPRAAMSIDETDGPTVGEAIATVIGFASFGAALYFLLCLPV